MGRSIYVYVGLACAFFTNFKNSGRGRFGTMAFNGSTVTFLMVVRKGIEGGGAISSTLRTFTARVFRSRLRGQIWVTRWCW